MVGSEDGSLNAFVHNSCSSERLFFQYLYQKRYGIKQSISNIAFVFFDNLPKFYCFSYLAI